MEDRQYTQYYVAFLDILGFKNLVNNTNYPCAEIINIYDLVQDSHATFFEGEAEDIGASVRMKIMSDSICLYIKTSFPNALFYLIAYCTAFQFDLLLEKGLLLRGAITSGNMYAKDDIIFGPALTEAYLLEEKNARVPRIIIRKETLDEGIVGIDKDSLKMIQQCTFRDDDAFYTLNYFLLLAHAEDGKVQERVKEIIADQLDTTIDDSIRQKYLYVEKNINRFGGVR